MFSFAFDANGSMRTTSGNLPTDFTFTGQKLDASDGLMYYGARYYDAALARFISADTLVPGAGNPQALNRYAYVYNNPVRYTDPSGHCIPLCAAALAVVTSPPMLVALGGLAVYYAYIGPTYFYGPDAQQNRENLSYATQGLVDSVGSTAQSIADSVSEISPPNNGDPILQAIYSQITADFSTQSQDSSNDQQYPPWY